MDCFHLGHGLDIMGVTHGKKRRNRLECVRSAGKRAFQQMFWHRIFPHGKPNGICVQFHFRKVDRPRANVFMRVKFNFFENRRHRPDHHIPIADFCILQNGLSVLFQHFQLHRQIGIRVIINSDFTDKGFFLFPVQLFNLILHRLMQINRLFMEQCHRAELVHFTDHAHIRRIGHIDNDDIFLRCGTKADIMGRKSIIHPVPRITAAVENPFIRQKLEHVLDFNAAKRFPFFKRQLVCRTFNMVH